MFRRSDRARRYARVLSSKRMVACDLYPHDDDACKTPSVSPFYERVNVRSSDVTNDFDFHPELLSRSLQFPLQSLAPLRSRLSRLRLGNIQRSSVGNLPSSPFPWSSLSLSLSFFLSFSFSLVTVDTPSWRRGYPHCARITRPRVIDVDARRVKRVWGPGPILDPL